MNFIILNWHWANKSEQKNRSVSKSGSPGRARTADPVINSHLLYRLSYWGISQRQEYYCLISVKSIIY